jgi:hypothetical protein
MASEFITLLEKGTPLITAIFGGIGVKVLDKILSKRSDVFNESVKIREELRTQIDSLRTELEEWKTEADEWRKKYWEQVEINISLKAVLESLKAEFDAFKTENNK